MKIPSVVKVLSHDYEVDLDPTLLATSGCVGRCNPSIASITIDSLAPETVQADTLLHEIIECLCYHLQLKMAHRDLHALSEGISSVIRDNDLDFRAQKRRKRG